MQFTNTFLNLAFRYEDEINRAAQSGQDMKKVLTFFEEKLKSAKIEEQILSNIQLLEYRNALLESSNAQLGTPNSSLATRNSLSKPNATKIVTIPIIGMLSRLGWYSYNNYQALSDLIDAYDADPAVLAIIFQVYSPGGGSDGNYIFADAVARCKTTTVVHTPFCYSAAYFGICPANLIILDNQAASGIGSIGCYMVHQQNAKQLEATGIVTTTIRSKQAVNKNLVNSNEPLPAKGLEKLQAQCDDCGNEFLGYVKRYRSGKIKSEALDGSEFTRKDAISVGLVDEVGSFQYAIQRAIAIASSK